MKRTDRAVAGIADKLISYRRFLAILFVAITVGLGWSASQVRLDPGFLKLIPVEHPYMETMMDYMDTFSGANRVLVSLNWQGEGDIYNKEFMNALQHATNDVFFIPGVDRTTVKSLFTPDTIYIRVTEDGFRGAPVVPKEYSATEAQLQQVQDNVGHSGQVGILVSDDHESALIKANLLPYDRSKGREAEQQVNYWQVFQELQNIRDKYESQNIEVNVIGFSMLLGFVIKGLLGVFGFFALAFAITVVLLYLYTRSLKITVTALGVALLPVLWLIGVLPLMGYGIDPMSILVPFLIFAIGVSHAVQMTSAWQLEMVNGADAKSAARASFTKLFVPGAVALLTEALGFGVIMFINIPIVQELGITAMLGVLLMIITNKMILPIILSHMSLSEKALAHSQKESGSRLWDKFTVFAEPRNALFVFVGAAVVMGFATWQSRDLVIGDTDAGTPELHPDSRYNIDSRAIMNQYDIGVDVLGVIVEAPDFEGGSCLQYPVINLVDRFELYMRGVAGVQSVKSVAGIGKRIVSAFNEGHPAWRALPRESSALTTASKAFNPKLGFVTSQCRAIQVMIFTENHKGSTLDHVVGEIKSFKADNDVEGVNMRLANGNMGVMAATNEAVESAEARMLLCLFGALIIFCLAAFRSWMALLCVMVPLVGVTVMGNALMAMLDIGLKVATLPVIALGVGVGVDYGIYLFERIQHYMHEPGIDFREAFRRSMHDRGSPIVFTAATMAVGVATWIMSALKYQADMGLLLAFLFLVNMVGAIVLLPALGAWFYRGPSRTR